MRKIFTLVIATFCVAAVHAQLVAKKKRCYTTQYLNQLQKSNPAIESQAHFEQWLAGKIAERKASPQQNAIVDYTPLPIIFHVLNTGQLVGIGSNLNQSQIVAQVVQLNKDYANLSGSIYSAASKSGLQFCLAQKDTNGANLAEPGIDRINTSGKTYGQPPYSITNFDTKVKPATIWDPTKYINVWVTEFTSAEGILGYATFPGSSTLDGLDNSETAKTAGVVIDYSTVGSIGTPSATCDPINTYTTGRTLTHELGHFFGLRHIWGDATCGDDYCDDTPVHEDANYGIPTHPKSNNCGTADEMFENYMDYTDDQVMSTFTLNQVERMQVVMINSTRRKTLPASTVGCTNSLTGNNFIGFAPCDGVLAMSEKSTMNTCPAYTDVKLYLSIEDKANGAATLTINTTGSTATKGVDFDVLTPTISIANGDAFKQVVIRVYDDAVRENDETINISYTISGNGVSANANLPQSFIITVADDDRFLISQNQTTLLSEDFGTSGNALPSQWNFLTSSDYPSPRNRFVVGSNATGYTGQSLYVTNSTTTRANTYTITTASAHYVRSKLIDASSSAGVNLSFKYKVAGEIDNDGPWDFGKVYYSTQAEPDNLKSINSIPLLVGEFQPADSTVKSVSGTANGALPAGASGNKIYLTFAWQNDDNTGTQPPLSLDDILVTADGTKVESDLNHSTTKNISAAASDSNFLVSTQDAQIIAMITNAGAAINCVSASIQQAGIGQVDVTTSIGTFKRSQKVIKLSPAVSSATTYSVTLYFTSAELAAWSSINDLKVVKVQDGVSLSSTLTAANAVLLTPVVNDLRTTNGYASFTVTATGFSQFFLVAANTTLPVQLLSFNATALNSGASLSWTTANEIANKGFNVQRSLDGQNFMNISFVAGKNSGDKTTDYTYFDAGIKAGIMYYYRLQQVDINGKTSLSAVRTVRIDASTVSFLAYPNPAKTFTHVVAGKNMTATLSLVSANGQTVWQSGKQNITTAGFNVPMETLPAGVYMLWIQDDKGRYNLKLIKE